MKRMITTLALAATMVLAMASVASAAPNANAGCTEASGAVNHGEHILSYVETFGNAGSGRPAHFGLSASPGASFCQGDNSAPDLGDDHKPILE